MASRNDRIVVVQLPYSNHRQRTRPRDWTERRWAGRLGLTGVALTLLVAILCTPTAHAASRQVRTAKQPVFVDIPTVAVSEWLEQAEGRRAIQDDLVDAVRAAATRHPGRLITIRRPGLVILEPDLPAADRRHVRNLDGRMDVQHRYEQAAADVLTQAVRQCKREIGNLQISVLGLPVEAGSTGAADALRSNARYARLIGELDAFVSVKSIILSGRGQSPESALRDSSPETFRLAGSRPVFLHANGSWRAVMGDIRTARRDVETPSSDVAESTSSTNALGSPPADPLSSPTTYDPLAELRAAWGQADSIWDLNEDGTVDTDDLMAVYGRWDYYSDPAWMGTSIDDGGLDDSDDDDDGGQPAGMARFNERPDPYALGSGVSLRLELLADAPDNANVVFQTWSNVSNTVEAAYPDSRHPFVYPAAALEEVPIGDAEIQALVRDDNNRVVHTVRLSTTFVDDTDPWSDDLEDDDDQEIGPFDPDGDGDDGDDDPDNAPGDDGDGTTPGSDDGPGGGPGEDGDDGDDDDGATNGPAPRPVIRAIATAGEAPFTVHVHALDTDLAAGDVLTARWEWDFGDAGSDYNALEGWNAAHTYDEPGTYTVHLRVTNETGRAAMTSIEVIVTPDNRARVYVASIGGNDSNTGDSPRQAVRSYARALQLMNNNATILFHRGQTFDVRTSTNIARRNWTMGAYGNGPKPILRWTGSKGFSSMVGMNGSSCRNVVIEDLHFDSAYESYSGRNIVDAIRPAGTNITVRRCSFGHVTMAINTERDPAGMLGQGNLCTNLRAYYVWGEGSDHTYLGNTVQGSTAEHNMRFANVDRVLIHDNDLTNFPKTCIWLMGGQYGYVTGNRLNDGHLLIGPNHAMGSPSDRYRWCVVERNVLDRSSAQEPALMVEHGARHTMARNNVIKTVGNASISIKGHSTSMNRTTVDVRILNNTAILSGDGGRFLHCGGGTRAVKIANNLFVAPRLRTGNHKNAILFILDPDLDEFEVICNNLWPVPAQFEWVGDGYHYVWASWSNADGFRNIDEWNQFNVTVEEAYANIVLDEAFAPPADSPAADHARSVPGVFNDFAGSPRPRGQAWTAGAVETGTTE